jgi:CubicO group peptidase (beta-lactamase class C family)
LLCEFDGAATMLGGSFCHASLRDWGAFGQMYLDSGRVAGRQVVSPGWVDFVRTPAQTDGGFGGHFWVNRPRPEGREDALFPKAGPADAFGAVGHLGQFVVIVPSKQLVVVRLGNTPDGRLQPVRDGLAALVAAVDAAEPAR